MSPTRRSNCRHFAQASFKGASSQGKSGFAAHGCPLGLLPPSDLLDHRRIVALAFVALHAGLEHRGVEGCERHLLPAARGLIEDQMEILQRLMDEALRRV